MRSRSSMTPRTFASVLSALALLSASSAALRPALADTPAAPTCQALENKCLKHVRIKASAPPSADGVVRPQMSETECYDSFHIAQTTGVWPAHVPFNFAIKCTS